MWDMETLSVPRGWRIVEYCGSSLDSELCLLSLKVQNIVILEVMGIAMLVSGSHDYNMICEY